MNKEQLGSHETKVAVIQTDALFVANSHRKVGVRHEQGTERS
nr:MAG TPA: hypothetical protein [Caudoviricetes sp.]